MQKRKVAALAAALGTTISLLGSSLQAGATTTTSPSPYWLNPGSLGGVEGLRVEYNVAPTQQFASTGSTTPLQGDFNGDGTDDVLFYGPGSNADELWLGKNFTEDPGESTVDRFTKVSITIGGHYKPFTGDFDGNSATDVFWYAPGTDADWIWYYGVNGMTPQSVSVAVNGNYTPTVGNFDTNDAPAAGGNGTYTDDIFWYGSMAQESMWSGLSNRTFQTRVYSTNIGTNAQVLVGNFKADTAQMSSQNKWFFPDIFFYVPGSGQDSLWINNGTGTFTTSNQTVSGTYQPIVGNFNTGQPGWAGGLTDIFWYTAGTKTDSIWMATGNGTFSSKTIDVNGTYKPFVIPGFAGPDIIVWNNPGGGDSVWVPKGSQGTWSYQAASWPGADMGSRQPLVGYWDDGYDNWDVLTMLSALNYSPETYACPCSTSTNEVRRADVLWWAPGNGTGQDERVWRLDGADITFTRGTLTTT